MPSPLEAEKIAQPLDTMYEEAKRVQTKGFEKGPKRTPFQSSGTVIRGKKKKVVQKNADRSADKNAPRRNQIQREWPSLLAALLAISTAFYRHAQMKGRAVGEMNPDAGLDILFPPLLITSLALVFVLQRHFPKPKKGRFFALWRSKPIIRGALLLAMWAAYALEAIKG